MLTGQVQQITFLPQGIKHLSYKPHVYCAFIASFSLSSPSFNSLHIFEFFAALKLYSRS